MSLLIILLILTIKILSKFKREPFNFLTIDTTEDKKFIKNFDETL